MCSCQENPKILLRICVFSFVYFLSVGIPILKIVLSHTQKSVTSDVDNVILENYFFSLVMSSLGGPGIMNG